MPVRPGAPFFFCRRRNPPGGGGVPPPTPPPGPRRGGGGVPTVDPAAATHERGGARADAPAFGGAHVLVLVPRKTHLVAGLVDEHVVLRAGRGVAAELDDRRVAEVLARRRALQQHR